MLKPNKSYPLIDNFDSSEYPSFHLQWSTKTINKISGNSSKNFKRNFNWDNWHCMTLYSKTSVSTGSSKVTLPSWPSYHHKAWSKLSTILSSLDLSKTKSDLSKSQWLPLKFSQLLAQKCSNLCSLKTSKPEADALWVGSLNIFGATSLITLSVAMSQRFSIT